MVAQRQTLSNGRKREPFALQARTIPWSEGGGLLPWVGCAAKGNAEDSPQAPHPSSTAPLPDHRPSRPKLPLGACPIGLGPLLRFALSSCPGHPSNSGPAHYAAHQLHSLRLRMPQRLRHHQMEQRLILPHSVRASLPRLFAARFLGRRRILPGAVSAVECAWVGDSGSGRSRRRRFRCRDGRSQPLPEKARDLVFK